MAVWEGIDPVAAAKATALSLAIKQWSGEAPTQRREGGKIIIEFTPAQADKIRYTLDRWHGKAPEPGAESLEVRIGGILGRYYARKYWGWAAGLVFIGLIIGGALKK